MKGKKGKGIANQYGRYVWIPSDTEGAEYTVGVWGKGLSVKVSGNDKDKVLADVAELIDRTKVLTKDLEQNGHGHED